MQEEIFTDLEKHELLRTIFANRLMADGLDRLMVKLAESITDKKNQHVAITVTAQYLAMCGNANEALALVDRYLYGVQKALALVSVASELAHSNPEASALCLEQGNTLLQEVKDEDDHVHLLQELANGYLELGKGAMALQLAHLVSQPSERAYTFCQIGKRFWDQGDGEKATQILEEARKAAEETKNPDKANTWDSVARFLAYIGRYEEAVAAWEHAIKFSAESLDQPKLLLIICKGLASIGRRERAREIALLIKNEARKAQVLALIEE